MTALPPSPFVSNSADVVMPSSEAAAATMTPSLPTAAAEPFDEYERDQRLRALYDELDPPQPPLFLRRPSIVDYRPDPSLRHILKVFFAMEA